MTTLLYNGNGKQHVTGIPARDLTPEEISRIAVEQNLSESELIQALTRKGLYSVVKPAPKTKKTEEPPTPSENEVIE